MRLLVLALLLAAVLSSTAAAATPAQYRARLNAMCRANTVQIRLVEAELRRAQAAQDARGLGIALGKLIGITLRQDARIEATPVPPALRTKMLPTIRILERADAVMRKLVGDAAAGRGTEILAGFRRLEAMAPTVNRRLDAAGLRACGSGQS